MFKLLKSYFRKLFLGLFGGGQKIFRITFSRVYTLYGILPEKIEKATRYYISSLTHKHERFQVIIRNHWAIENKLHWSLDVAFGEDYDRKRSENAAQNFYLINIIALNMVKNEATCMLGIKSKRKITGWNEGYLLKILGF